MAPAALAIASVCFAAQPSGAEPGAADLFREGQKAEKAGQSVRAYLLYAQAAAKDPTNVTYWTKAQSLRPAASLADPAIGAALGGKPDEKPSPKPPIDSSLFGSIPGWEIEEAQRHPLPPPQLHAATGRRDFNLKGDSKALFEQVAGAFNLLVVFDTAYQPRPAIHFEVDGVDYRDALRALEDATDSFIVPNSDRLILVANDTPQKRTELESTAAVVIPIPDPVTVQEIQEVATAIRGVLDIHGLMVDTQRRLVVMRDRVWKVRAAEMLFHDLMRARPQVAIDIDIVTIDKTKTSTWGLDLPTTFPLLSFGKLIGRLPQYFTTSGIPAGFASFLTFGAGASFMGLGLTSGTLFATATDSMATTLLQSEVVTSDGAPVSFHAGQKYPIMASSYSGTPGVSGQLLPAPQINFEDLGLILKITPRAHGMDEMSLDVSAEFKLLGASSLNGIPVINDRKLESKVRLRNGEWAVLAGLASKSELETVTGLPGLTMIPFLRKKTKEEDRSDTLIVLKPHLLNLPPTEALTRLDWIGTETRPREL